MLEDPLVGDQIGVRRSRDQIPRVVLQKSSMFFLYSCPPIRISKGTTEDLRNRRQRGRGEERGLPEAELHTGNHAMLVDDEGAPAQRPWAGAAHRCWAAVAEQVRRAVCTHGRRATPVEEAAPSVKEESRQVPPGWRPEWPDCAG